MYKLIFILLPIYLHAEFTKGLADNFTKGFSQTLLDGLDLINPILILLGVGLILYAIYELFLDDNPQKRGVTSMFGSLIMMAFGFLLVSLKKLIEG